jgi:drug/metabolite transporter (DMT)-like permease
MNAIAVMSGLIAAMSWGTSDFFAAKASRRLNSFVVTIFVMVFTALSFSVVYALALRPSSAWVGGGILLSAIAGLLMTIAVTAFYRGLSIGTVSIVSPIGAAYPLVTTLLVLAVFHESLLFYQVIGIVVTVMGIMVTSGLLGVKRRELKLDSGVALALIACIAWGTMFALLGKATEMLGWEKATLVEVWFMVIGCLAILPFISLDELFGRKALKIFGNAFVLLAAFLQTTGVVALNFGFTHSTSAAIETTISACYPILTVVLAILFLKEKIGWMTRVGIVATIIGVATISYR